MVQRSLKNVVVEMLVLIFVEYNNKSNEFHIIWNDKSESSQFHLI